MARVLIAPAPLQGVEGEYREILRAAGHEPVQQNLGRQLVETELLDWLKGIDATLAGSEPYTRKAIESRPGLRVIARVGVGYDAVDVQAATEFGRAVTIAPGTNHGSVAEHAFSLMLALAKRVVVQHNAVARGEWPRGINRPLRGSVLGLAGLGRTGKAVALRAQAFEMRVIAYEPFPDRDFCARHGIELVDFDKLLEMSDWLSLHLPATPQSKHIINADSLARMKRGAMLINTARGAVVDEKALASALESGHLGGAGLDVFEQEPPGKLSFFDRPNVVFTPHVAGVDSQSLADMAASAARSVVEILDGKWPDDGRVVNPTAKTHKVS
jgi:phosphoglycerate dehydrogenase-like enzyme